VALRQPHAGSIPHQPAMKKIRSRDSERAVDEQLTRRRFQKIGAAHNFADPHRVIVGHYGKLIGSDIVPPPHHEVTEILPGNELLRPEPLVHKANSDSGRHPEAPIHPRWRWVRGVVTSFSTCARVQGFIVSIIRRVG
jgi:hypothetical protein